MVKIQRVSIGDFAAGASSVVAAVVGAWATLRARRAGRAHVDLVAISFLSGTKVENHLDFKLKNTGGQVAILTDLIVEIKSAWSFSQPKLPDFDPPIGAS